MQVSAATHLFGSVSGYRCLARSPGVSQAEDEALSDFGFGQSADEDFLAGLRSRPSAYGRPLPGGRFGITRVLRGPPDDHGRATLRRLTIILPSATYVSIRGALPRLVLDARLWESAAFESSSDVSFAVEPGSSARPGPDAQSVLGLWNAARATPGLGVIAGEGAEGTEVVLQAVAGASPADAAVLPWGVGLLVPMSSVSLIAMSPFGLDDGRRPVVRRGEAVPHPRPSANAGVAPSVSVAPAEVERSAPAVGRRWVLSGEALLLVFVGGAVGLAGGAWWLDARARPVPEFGVVDAGDPARPGNGSAPETGVGSPIAPPVELFRAPEMFKPIFMVPAREWLHDDNGGPRSMLAVDWGTVAWDRPAPSSEFDCLGLLEFLGGWKSDTWPMDAKQTLSQATRWLKDARSRGGQGVGPATLARLLPALVADLRGPWDASPESQRLLLKLGFCLAVVDRLGNRGLSDPFEKKSDSDKLRGGILRGFAEQEWDERVLESVLAKCWLEARKDTMGPPDESASDEKQPANLFTHFARKFYGRQEGSWPQPIRDMAALLNPAAAKAPANP